MTSHDYDVWNSKNTCTVDTSLVDAVAVTQDSSEFVIPKDDRYRFLIENYSHDKDANVKMNAQVVGVATSSSFAVTSTETHQDYATQTIVAQATITQTLTSLRTEQVPGGGFSLAGSNMLFIAAGIIVGVAVVGTALALRARQSKTKERAKPYEAEPKAKPKPSRAATTTLSPPVEPVTQSTPSRAPPPGMKFCIHCGEPIPRNAQFCTNINCGKPQN